MGLFRPYERNESTDKKSTGKKQSEPKPKRTKVVSPTDSKAEEIKTKSSSSSKTSGKKSRPTPTRKEAEAARMERLHPTLSKREARKKARAAARIQQEEDWRKTERSSERLLLRDFIDSRWTLPEFMLPLMLVFLAVTMLISTPGLAQYATYVSAALWTYLVASLVNVILLWRKFKAELAHRFPKASTQGLLVYLVNRSMMIRRFRQPRPRISRGDSY